MSTITSVSGDDLSLPEWSKSGNKAGATDDLPAKRSDMSKGSAAGSSTDAPSSTDGGRLYSSASGQAQAEQVPIFEIRDKRIAAVVLESDEDSVVCEIATGDLVNLPRTLIPEDCEYGSSIWIGVADDYGVKRFTIEKREPDPERLAESKDEINELLASFD